MIDISIKANNLPQARRKFSRMAKKIKNTGPLMKKISIFLDQWVQKNFKSEGGKTGGWEDFKYGGRVTTKTGKRSGKPALKPNAVNLNPKLHINTSSKLLQDTGELRASFKPFSTIDNAGIGSDLPYAPKHEEGFEDTPKRRMLPEDQDVMGEVLKKANEHIKRSLKVR